MTTKTDSNTKPTGARIAHPVEISDLKAGTKYIAACESECESETDRSAYREAIKCRDVVTMGCVVARPLPSSKPFPGPHTQGPWTAHEFKDGTVELTEYAGSAVAYIEPVKFRSKSERRANAKLIAAAPDLLAACKAFEGYYCGAPDSPTRGMAHAYEIVRVAIARAEGKNAPEDSADDLRNHRCSTDHPPCPACELLEEREYEREAGL
jgi:hypothetical protein